MINKFNNWSIYTCLTLISFLTTFLFSTLITTKEFLYNSYSEQLAKEQINQLLESQDKWVWVGYLIMPLIILIRVCFVSICLSIGVFFYNMESKIKYKQFFRVSLIGEFVLVSVGYFKFSYFYFIKTDYNLLDIQQFYPFSYTTFLDVSKLEPWLVYPLQTINLFEMSYFFVLVYGLHKLLKNKYMKSFEIVVVSYGTGLIIWLGLIMFLTLNIS